jgi:two-component system phosphate regulon response regulator PhoB
MSRPRVLVVEDVRAIREGLADALAFHGYAAVQAERGDTGLDKALHGGCDLVLLDLVLPGGDGLAVLRELRRAHPTLPVIILTARGAEADRVRGLREGADDYVTKPFSPRELAARVKALLRRAEPAGDVERAIEVGRLLIDPSSYRVTRAGKALTLSTLEFRLIYYLAARPNRVFTRDQLLDAVWGTDRFVTPRSVDVYIRRLREKIETDPENPVHLKTVRGAGYLFESAAVRPS